MFFKRGECRAKGGALGFKVEILGATGGIGQSLSLLMMMNPLVSILHLYDVVNTPSVTTDVSHMDTGVVVRGFPGQQQLESALTSMDLVIILAGVLRKPRMTRDYLFKINVRIVRILSRGIAKCCPNAIVNLISNLVNSTVAIAAEVSKKVEVLGVDPREVGCLSGVTILPLLSQDKPPSSFTSKETEYLTNRIQNGGTKVVEGGIAGEPGSEAHGRAFHDSSTATIRFFDGVSPTVVSLAGDTFRLLSFHSHTIIFRLWLPTSAPKSPKIGFFYFKGIDGQVETRLPCGTIVVEERSKLAKESRWGITFVNTFIFAVYLVIHNSSSVASYKTSKSYISLKKTRIEVQNDDDDDDDDEYFSVPDLG
ncbi:hypothetical protein JHK85_010909 [Glycine max]|nr:hypothetical protein JHK85_010909 [Glycine max]